MTDPLEALRSPLTPLDPDPDFAATLRARVARALSLPRGVSMLPAAPTPVPTAMVITPYLAVGDARRALQWYADAFGARASGPPIVMPDGKVGHAEIEIGGARLMLSDAYPEIGVVAPEAGRGTAVTLHLELAGVDAATARAVAAGATLERSPADNPYGRSAVVLDPFGHRWMLMTATSAPPASSIRNGDIGYVSLLTPDVERAAAFYGSALGWTYLSSEAGGRLTAGTTPQHGLVPLASLPPIFAGLPHPTLVRSHAVDDIDAAVRRVRDAGGEAEDPAGDLAGVPTGTPPDGSAGDLAGVPTGDHAGVVARTPSGRIVNCLDPDGAPFSLHEAVRGAPRGPAHGSRDGDISYLTVHVTDSHRARNFYGAVFGWEFAPGAAPDGWEPRDVVPMVGMSGGHSAPAAVAMYRVADISAAVARVRAGGGTATEPEARPYGLQSECTDDQGTPFYLGQH